MPEKRICDGCGKEYWWPGAKWQHIGCVKSDPPKRDEGKSRTRVVSVKKDRVAKPQTWTTREEYKAHMRAYMRDYMRKRRAEKT